MLVLKWKGLRTTGSLPRALFQPFAAMVSLPPEIVRHDNLDCSPKSWRDVLVQSNKAGAGSTLFTSGFNRR